MAYDKQIKCPNCGVSVPDVPEDADKEAMLCNACYDTSETKQIWLCTCDDIFGGYGLTAIGDSKIGAQEALWAKYKEVSPGWNDESTPACKSFAELSEEWGIWTRELTINKGYFGDEDDE